MSGGFADILESLGKKDRGKLESKIPAWAGVEIEVPSSLNFQQCSGQSAALYKASLISENCRVADLTGGLIGGAVYAVITRILNRYDPVPEEKVDGRQ
ncbi:MAG: hypothetical protein II053_04270 [Bacteroidales bacterium]|nr:hypothetical protein [Bacteroidales bacterium]